MSTPLNEVPVVDGFTMRLRDAETLEVDVPKSHSLNRVFIELERQGIAVLSMRNKANRLEELFMHLVERNLPDEQAVDTGEVSA